LLLRGQHTFDDASLFWIGLAGEQILEMSDVGASNKSVNSTPYALLFCGPNF